MSFAAFTASDSGFPSFGDLDIPTYPLSIMFQESLEMAQAQFSDEQFSMSFDNTTTMATEVNETRSSNVEDVCNAISRQHSVDTSKTPSSPTGPTNPSDFSAINNQDSASPCPASRPRLSGLHLRIYQPMNNDQRDLVPGATGDAIGDLECEPHEYHSNDCASDDQVSCRASPSRLFFPPTLLSCTCKIVR